MAEIRIYLDNAATSYPKPENVYRAMDQFQRQVGASPGRSGHAAARTAGKTVSETRDLLAQLFHAADPSQIVFTANATESLNLGLKGLLTPGDHVVTTATDHNSVLRPLRSLEDNLSIEVSRVACDATGAINLDDIKVELRSDTRLVCMTHASNVTGTVHDIRAVSDLVNLNGTLLMVDAAQTAGCVPIDVQAMGIDLLAFTGHKGLLGPQGTGGLYIRPGLEISPLCEGGTGSESSSDHQPTRMPDRLESGTPNTPGLAGLGAAVRFILDTGLDKIAAHEQALTEQLIAQLSTIESITIHGPAAVPQRTAVVSFTMRGLPPLNLAHLLDSGFGIATRSGLHCAPLIHQYLSTANSGTVRASIGYFNTAEEIEVLCAALRQIVSELR
jgi:cysteine desulfurase/selenocysteine lyase